MPSDERSQTMFLPFRRFSKNYVEDLLIRFFIINSKLYYTCIQLHASNSISSSNSISISISIIESTILGCSSSNANNDNKLSNANTTNSSTEEVVVSFVQADSLASTLKSEKKDILVVDVRDDNEYSAGFIKDAINIPSSQFDDDAAKANLLNHIKVSSLLSITSIAS